MAAHADGGLPLAARPLPDEPSPEETLNHICERLTAGLKAAGISAVRQNEQAIHRWLVRWFNPRRPLRIKSLLATTGFTGS